jgi:hypothetical protein
MTTLEHLCTKTSALEVLADIARILGEHRLGRNDDRRDHFPDFVLWADEFKATYQTKCTAAETYYEDIETFTLDKAAGAGFAVAPIYTYVVVRDGCVQYIASESSAVEASVLDQDDRYDLENAQDKAEFDAKFAVAEKLARVW